MKPLRIFFCIELSDELKDKLFRITETLRTSGSPHLQAHFKVGWVKKENLHVTLKFLGEIEPAKIEELKSAAEAALMGIAPFELRLDKLGAFPSLARPRVIWVGSTTPPQEIYTLHDSLESNLAKRGSELEEESYTPHVTLGRVKEHKKNAAEDLARKIQSIEKFSYIAKAGAITLMESVLTKSGPIYTPIFRLEFVG